MKWISVGFDLEAAMLANPFGSIIVGFVMLAVFMHPKMPWNS